jgi:molybdate transport system ATP-binding protein
MSLPEINPESPPHLSFEMKHRVGALSLDVAFELTQPWTLLFAPSGAGKTTILRAIAGLLQPEGACLVSRLRTVPGNAPPIVGERILIDTARGISIPPHQRGVRMVSQNAALFPHLNVIKNIRYNFLRLDREPEENKQFDDYLQSLLALCRVEHLTAKMPAQLSGGERQRVALARSLAAGGYSLLLLDEPFTALDAALRDELITDLRAWLARGNIRVLAVTHDISEAFQLNAEVIKLQNGGIAAQGPASVVLAEERRRLLEQLSGRPDDARAGNADSLRE